MADDFDPDAYLAGTQPAIAAPPAQPNISSPDDFSNFNPNSYLQEKTYGTPSQQALTGIEGAAQGVIGPLAPYLEQKTGLTTGADIRARAEANPVTHGVSEAGAFVGSMFFPVTKAVGLAGAVGKVGELAEAGSKLALLPKIATTGIKAGAEMAALATSDELSKMVTGDPNQTLGSAATQIGLSGIIGGAGGLALGAVSPLWNKTSNILGVDKTLSDFMGETKALQGVADPVATASNELTGRVAEADNMWQAMSDTKPEVLAQAMPKATAENVAKIDGQIQDIYGQVNDALKKADQSIKTKNAVPFLSEDLANFQQAVQATDATPADKFIALNKLKTTLQGYAKWATTEESTAKGALGRALSNVIKPALEDTSVWGAAGDVQKVTNGAISDLIDATKDFKGPITTKTLGEAQIDPAKVQSLINQTNAGKISRKANVVGNYLDATQKYADAIRQVHLDNGLQVPWAARLNPTPFLDHALNTEVTPGVQLARYLNAKGANLLSGAAGKTAGGAVGAGLGAIVGHPIAGGWVGEKVLGPMFSSLAKPFLENAVDSAAAKSTVDYVGNAIKGQRLLGNTVSNVFRQGAEVIGKEFIPNEESRKNLEDSLSYFQNPSNATKVGGAIGHYLPAHGTAAAQLASTAANYLNALKPKQAQMSPLDAMPPVDKSQQAVYNRALDIAQQPLMALQHVKDGTLLPQDVQTLRTIYPGLHDAIIKKMSDSLIAHKAEGGTIPYPQRVSMNLLMGGAPLDSTMTPQVMQSIMMSASPKSQIQAEQTKSGGKKAGTGVALNQINKVNSLYQTPLEARQADKRS